MKTLSSLPWGAVLLAASVCPTLRGGGLQKSWEMDLGDAISGPARHEGFRPGILALGFSPDGKKIAVASNPYTSGQPVMSRIFVLQVGDPKAKLKEFDIADIASDSPVLGGRPPAIAWSPAGNLIVAGLAIIKLKEGRVCQIPDGNSEGFLSGDQVIASVLHRMPLRSLEVFDSECKSGGAWGLEYADWALRDVSPERGFVSVTQRNPGYGLQEDPAGELVVLDPIGRKVIRKWLNTESGYEARFADHGRVLCAGDDGADLYQNRKVPPRCMDVDTGERIAEARGIVGGAPFAAAEQGSRIVASDHRSRFNFLFREYDTTLTRRVIWDFRTNTEVASWKPDSQTYSLLGGKPIKEPFVFSISPDGEYIAEGGNGILRLYKIEP